MLQVFDEHDSRIGNVKKCSLMKKFFPDSWTRTRRYSIFPESYVELIWKIGILVVFSCCIFCFDLSGINKCLFHPTIAFWNELLCTRNSWSDLYRAVTSLITNDLICDKIQSSCWASQAVCETEKRRVVYICGWEILTDKEAFKFFAAWSLAWYSNEASRPSAPFV